MNAELGALAVMAAARAVTPDARAGQAARRDPLEHLAWIESGAPFDEAGITGFMEAMPRSANAVSGDVAARLRAEAELARGAAPALGDRYMAIVPHERRHAAGRYFTPRWLAALVLDRAGFDGAGSPGLRLVDPMCGAGVFLVEAIERMRRARADVTVDELARRVHGVEIDSLAALLARAAWLIAAAGAPREGTKALRVPVACADAILGEAPGERFDVVAGNPPWVGWESLTPEFRSATRPLWERYGLFAAGSGSRPMQHLLGGGRKDLSMLATAAAADRWLATGGRLAFVLPRAHFQAGGSAAGFRRLRLPGRIPLGVVEVDDLSATRPFGAAGAPAVVALFQKGSATRWPVPWRVRPALPSAAPRELAAAPIDPAEEGSPWIAARAERLPALRARLGASSYRARAGAYTGGANGVYWVRLIERAGGGLARVRNLADDGLREIPIVEALVEEELLYPLMRPRDLKSPRTEGDDLILLPQDPVRRRGLDRAEMERRFPRALDYLTRFAGPLALRRDRGTRSLIDAGAPFYSIFSVSAETLVPWKVVWPRIASRVAAVAVGPRGGGAGRPVVPQETCTFIACSGREEAFFLSMLLSSDLFNEIAAALAQPGGKSFGAPNLLERIAVPRFDPRRREHAALAQRAGAGAAAAAMEPLVAEAWEVS